LSALSDETLVILTAKSKGETVKRPISAFLTTYQQVKPILTDSDLKATGSNQGYNSRRFLTNCSMPGSMGK
jgi:tRNA nucleotidyltransferase (CCA-adding enzyme)